MGIVPVGVLALVKDLHGFAGIGLLGYEAMFTDGIVMLGDFPAVIDDDKVDFTHFDRIFGLTK